MSTGLTEKQKYRNQMARAKHRGIEWNLTFEQWMRIWEESGKWQLRGKGMGKYVMARNGDVGPYSPENVSIIPYEQNATDANINHPDKCGGTKRTGLGRGSYRVKRGNRITFLSRFRGKYLGVFDTPEEAEAAYRTAHSKYLTETAQK